MQLVSHLAGRGCTWAVPVAPGTCLLTNRHESYQLLSIKDQEVAGARGLEEDTRPGEAT